MANIIPFDPHTDIDPVEGELEAPNEGLNENEVLRLIDDEIAHSVCFETDSSILQGDSNAPREREAAMEYYKGIMRDVPSQKGWSSAVSKDVADTIDFMLPGLLRVFAGAGEVVNFEPGQQGDEPAAQQATDYINYLWDNELEGYSVLYTAIHDALLVRNGILKLYWDPTPTYSTEDLSGITEDQIAYLMQDPEVEIVGAQPGQQTVTDPMSGQTQQIPVYALKIRRVVQSGKLVLEAVPPEDFGVSSEAKSLDRARMVWHRSIMTRSTLLKQGYPRDVVDDLPAYGGPIASTGVLDRTDSGFVPRSQSAGWAMDEIEVFECYPVFDGDGTGVACRHRVLVAGGRGGRKILARPGEPLWEQWPDDDTPFVDLTPKPVPHRWMGASIADDVMDLQRVKTALMRQMLDNLYLVNRPQREVEESKLVDPDEVYSVAVGGAIRVKPGGQGAVRDLVVPYIGDKALQGIQYVDSVIQKRTGVSHSSAALDATALQPQTATAEQIEHDANYARIELVARNIAELGLKRLFRKMLKLVVRHQDRPRTIRLRNEWTQMDPRSWNASMDVTVNVGLGTGSRERDLAMLGGIAAQQDRVVEQLGPNNPIVTPSMWVATRHKMVEASGLRGPDQFFSPLQDEQFAQWQQGQQQAQPPDPEMLKVQALQAKAQIDAQHEVEKAQRQAQIEMAQAQADIETERQKAQMQALLMQEKHRFEIEMQREKFQLDLAIAQAKTQADLEHERAKLDHGMRLEAYKVGADEAPPDAPAVSEGTNDMLARHMANLSRHMARAAEAQAAPKRVLRDETGSIVGVEPVVPDESA